MSGEPIDQQTLWTLFEAARWAPSTYNEQEWRFLYAHRDTENWPLFFDLLMEANQLWCSQASVLVVVASHKFFERNGKPNPVHTFDVGAAFQNLSLQGTIMNLVVHGMAGFHRSMARTKLGIPDEYEVEAMIAIGRPGDPGGLPEALQQREFPTPRKPVSEFVCEGRFEFPASRRD
jgi:nitroreductase